MCHINKAVHAFINCGLVFTYLRMYAQTYIQTNPHWISTAAHGKVDKYSTPPTNYEPIRVFVIAAHCLASALWQVHWLR